ncbi:MAG TPA: ABC transporter substrate-binding protein [Acidimicrobiales bacterium]|nr:ABC transporter substrate-binding protein [Acidimicrobiales bacterium]
MEKPGEATGRRGGSPRRGIALAVLPVLLLAVAACGGDDDDASTAGDETTSGSEATDLLGPEDAASGEPVRIAMVSDGATQAFDNTDELRTAEATAEYWNTHRGGVGGRPIEIVTCETGADPAGGTNCANQMVEEQVVAVALSQSAVADAVWEPLHAAGVPTLFFQTSAEDLLSDGETSFTMVNPLATLFGVPIAVAESEGTDKIAFVNIDVPQANASFESGAADAVLGNAGLEYELVKIPPGTADMTSQMQEVAESDAGVVQIIGNDAFCIAAIQGLNAVGYEGQITSISQCITDATREAVPGDQLEGISLTATMAVGATDDPAYQLYQEVMDAYGEDVEDVENALAMGAYTTVASLAAALEGIADDITPEAAAEAIKSMDEADYPGADGLTFQCGGTAFPDQPAVCSNNSLRATLDAEGNPASYEPVDSSDIVEGL